MGDPSELAYDFLVRIVKNELIEDEDRIEAVWQLVKLGDETTLVFFMDTYRLPAPPRLKTVLIEAIGTLAQKLKEIKK